MNMPVTASGSLGSRFEAIMMSPESAGKAALVDWNRLGRRVTVDAVSGLVSWMSPSSLHEIMTGGVEDVIVLAAEILKRGISSKLRATRWKYGDGAGKTAMEPDAAFYIGKKVQRFRTACRQGNRDAFIESVPPDLVVEVEAFHADSGKPEKWAELGVREMWLLEKGKDDPDVPQVTILRMRPEIHEVPESSLLPGVSRRIVSKAVYFMLMNENAEMKTYLEKAVRKNVSEMNDGPGF